MNKEEILEGNRLIAEFMDAHIVDIPTPIGEIKCWQGGGIDAIRHYDNFIELKYHSSWDWLKPVVDKIFEYALAYPEEVKPIVKMSIVVGILPAWERVVNFIKLYNQSQNKTIP